MDGAIAQEVVKNGPSWITALGELTPVVAIALLLVGIVVLFVYSQRRVQKSTLETIETLNRLVVTPMSDSHREAIADFKIVIANHLEHDAVDRAAHTVALQRQTEAFTELVDCIREQGGKQ